MTSTGMLTWAIAVTTMIVTAPNAAGWTSSVIQNADPSLPTWVTQGLPTTGVIGGMAWALKVVLPRIVAFIDRGIAMLDRIEKKLDASDKRDADAEREELRDVLAALRKHREDQP